MTIQPNFQINGNNLPSPSTHKWIEPDDKGENGVGRRLYTPYFNYELTWNFLTQVEFRVLTDIWRGHYGSGTATAKLPDYYGAVYGFTNYTGVYMDRPLVGNSYKENYVADIKVIIRRISP